MNKVNYEIYILAMTELLINNNNQTDLGEYVLEYSSNICEIGTEDMVYGELCLAISVRLKNKNSSLIEWGNVYYKRLDLESNLSISKENVEKKLSEIYEGEKEHKLDFILKSESKILKKPYMTSKFVDPQLVSFFQNLNGTLSYDSYPTIKLGGKFPKDVILCLNDVFNDNMEKIKNSYVSNIK